MSSVANLGQVKPIAVHGGSGRIFGVNEGKLLGAFSEDEEVEIVAENAGFIDMEFVGDHLVALTNTKNT